MDKEQFLVEGEFIISSYDPPNLVKGMNFITIVTAGLPNPEVTYFTLDNEEVDKDTFIGINGAPVILNIITTGEGGEIIALHDEIGVFDDGSKNLRAITDSEINVIINQYNGIMNVECDETGDPILYEGQVIISYLSDPENEEE